MIGHYFVIFTSVPVGHKSHARLLTRLRTQTYILSPQTARTHKTHAEMRHGEMGWVRPENQQGDSASGSQITKEFTQSKFTGNCRWKN
jgi:hypothetical protein